MATVTQLFLIGSASRKPSSNHAVNKGTAIPIMAKRKHHTPRLLRLRPRTRWILFCCVLALISASLFGYLISTIQRSRDEEEIDSLLQSLTISKDEQVDQMKQYKLSFYDRRPRRVLLVGMIASLKELHKNKPVISDLSKVCWLYQHNRGRLKEDENIEEGFLSIHILYSQGENVEEDKDVELSLTAKFEQVGCKTKFVTQETLFNQISPTFADEFLSLNRYSKLSKLRSIHRRQILQAIQQQDSTTDDPYDIVMNVDLDIINLPPIHTLTNAVERVSASSENGSKGAIVCANGYETWNIFGLRRHLFYDTMAAVDTDGSWFYTDYATNSYQVATFGQTVLFRDILRQGTRSWPMQTCFGGLAVYDYDTWSTPECDYDRDYIKLLKSTAPSASPPGEPKTLLRSNSKRGDSSSDYQDVDEEQWTIEPSLTLGYDGRDACEHVVFQQCLRAAADLEGVKDLVIGIQPNLLLRREPAFLSQWEDIQRLSEFVVKIALTVATFATLFAPLVKFYRYSVLMRFKWRHAHTQCTKQRIWNPALFK